MVRTDIGEHSSVVVIFEKEFDSVTKMFLKHRFKVLLKTNDDKQYPWTKIFTTVSTCTDVSLNRLFNPFLIYGKNEQ
jgi:hypothetical protein